MNPAPVAAPDQAALYVIVSDSGGPLPRTNLAGEFDGWGGSQAAGTVIELAPAGHIAAVEKVAVGPKPRIAVALDFIDVHARTSTRRVLAEKNTLVSRVYSAAERARPKRSSDWFEFTLNLSDYIADARRHPLQLVHIALYLGPDKTAANAMRSCVLVPLNNGGYEANRPALAAQMTVALRADANELKEWAGLVSRLGEENGYAQFYFATDNPAWQAAYNFDSPWTFPIKIRFERNGIFRDRFILEKHTGGFDEFPDWDKYGSQVV